MMDANNNPSDTSGIDPKYRKKIKDLVRTLSTHGENNRLKYGKTDDLLKVLNSTRAYKPEIAQMFSASTFGGEEAPVDPADFMSFRTKKGGDIRVAEYNKDLRGYNPSTAPTNLNQDMLDKLSGRTLNPSETKDLRGLLRDPAMLKYFMEMREDEPKKREFRNTEMGGFSPSKGGNKGVGTGGGSTGEKGKIVEMIKDGVAYICLDGTCKPK
tara:strand:+ start:375 stop:1010 length:636 start_codon:yes stop_codon:yes gene_type:complete